jgi:hypothetical protein
MLGSTRTNSEPTTIFYCQACIRSKVSDIYPVRTHRPPLTLPSPPGRQGERVKKWAANFP